jgi:hypothetical protein
VIVDWDESGSLITSREYARRVLWEFDTHCDWDHIFRPYCPDSYDCLDLQLSDNVYVQPPLVVFPPGRVVGPLAEDKLCIQYIDVSGRIGRTSVIARPGVDMKHRNGTERREKKDSKGRAKGTHSGGIR